jgi:hypothetical protein
MSTAPRTDTQSPHVTDNHDPIRVHGQSSFGTGVTK